MIANVGALASKIKENVQKVIVGKDKTITLMLVALFSGGHMLLEDVPGTGKTMLVKSLAKSLDATTTRIQFTPDLLPSDITGIRYFNMKSSEFEFVPGPVFTNILLADEINRATPKTQAGLLECMEEKQATVDGTTYPLASPFMVIATQNPIENLGVFPLPEAQLDRFIIKASMSYPTKEETANILARFGSENPLETLESVATTNEINQVLAAVPQVFIHPDLVDYIASIVEATRESEGVELGASPRGAIALQSTSKALAAIRGRDYVVPDDIKDLAIPVLAHRLVLTSGARANVDSDKKVIEEVLRKTYVPTEQQIFWKKM